MSEFRIGDKVRVVKDTSRAGAVNLLGREGIIIRVDGSDYLVKGVGWGGWFVAAQLEHRD